MPTNRNVIAAVLACATLAACKSNNQSGAGDSAAGNAGVANAPSVAPGMSTITDTGGKSAAAASAGGNAGGTAGGAAGAGAMSDANILGKASAGDSAEVALAKYVAANTTNSGVKSFAQMLERDHGKGLSKVEATAKKAGTSPQLPAGDTTMQGSSHMLDRLKSLKGQDLDTAFVNHEVVDHQHDIDESKQMESSAQKPEVKTLLKDELPELQKHLAAAQKLQTQLASGKK